MFDSDYTVPEEPSGLVTLPGLESVPELLEAGRSIREGWTFDVAGLPVAEFWSRARRSSMRAACDFCAKMGIAFRDRGGPLIVTGHQPLLFHPGIWVKNWLVEGVSASLGGTGLNLVVDSDTAGDAGFAVPSWDGHRLSISRRSLVAPSEADAPFESVPAPDKQQLHELCESVAGDLSTLPRGVAAEAFRAFSGAMLGAASDGIGLAELVTLARRRYEEGGEAASLELPVSSQCDTDEFLLYFLSLAEGIDDFLEAYNGALDEYRGKHDVRSVANPFPNLAIDGDLVETPFWLMDEEGLRATLWLRRKGDLAMVCHADGCKVELARGRYADNIAALRAGRIHVRPKALALTLFNRMFVADLFVHGVGGAKYDRVTDEIARRFFGVDAPGYLVATATMWLTMGIETGTRATVAELRQRLHSLEHNPDRFVDDPSVPAEVRPRIAALAAEKTALVERISLEGADKKTIGAGIRRVNESLAELLTPLRATTMGEISMAEEAEESADVARYRGFPFCYWRPEQVAGLVSDALSDAGPGLSVRADAGLEGRG